MGGDEPRPTPAHEPESGGVTGGLPESPGVSGGGPVTTQSQAEREVDEEILRYSAGFAAPYRERKWWTLKT